MLNHKIGLTAFHLKILGITLMVFDHMHQMFYFAGIPMWFTMLGRIVAPIFIFLSAEGFHYTRNRKRYMITLLVGFWLCQILFQGVTYLFPNEHVTLMNSIFGTLFLGTLLMWIYDNFKERKIVKGILGTVAFATLSALPLMLINLAMTGATLNPWLLRLILFIPSPFTVEGGILFILMALFLYIARGKRWLQVLIIASVAVISYLTNPTGIQWLMIFSAIPLILYNGSEGRKEKWFFYIFYPAHIIILYVLSTTLFM